MFDARTPPELAEHTLAFLAPRDLAVGMTVRCGPDAPFAPGNAMELGLIPEGAEVHNIESLPGHGGKLVRSAGMSAASWRKPRPRTTRKICSAPGSAAPISTSSPPASVTTSAAARASVIGASSQAKAPSTSPIQPTVADIEGRINNFVDVSDFKA